jgi:hypothetical protein
MTGRIPYDGLEAVEGEAHGRGRSLPRRSAPRARRGARRPLPHRAPADGRYARYEYILL